MASTIRTEIAARTYNAAQGSPLWRCRIEQGSPLGAWLESLGSALLKDMFLPGMWPKGEPLLNSVCPKGGALGFMQLMLSQWKISDWTEQDYNIMLDEKGCNWLDQARLHYSRLQEITIDLI